MPKNLFQFIEDEKINNNNLVKCSTTINKYTLLKVLPFIQITYYRNNQYIDQTAISIQDLNCFLAFDLSNSINSEITKVKPTLKADRLNLQLKQDGVLQLTNIAGNNKVSVNSYNFDKHSLILGQSGSGKTYFMKLLIDDIYQNFSQEYGIVLIDPHADFINLLSNIQSQSVINFKSLQTNLFINTGRPTLSTELAIDLFSPILNINEHQEARRVLKHSLKLLFMNKKMNLVNLKKLLTDILFRKQLLRNISNRSLLNFFETEYQALVTSKYETAVLPIVNLVSELDFISSDIETRELSSEIDHHFLVTLPISRAEFGSNVTKIIGGAIIQQIFILMQSKLINKKIILMIDEFALVQNPSLIHILSEARKFGLTIILAQQYLVQVSAQILHSVYANAINYFCFKLSRDDAETIARNLNFEIDEYFLKNKNDPREIHELGVKLLTDLSPRETIARIMANNRHLAPFKATTSNINKI